MAAGEDAAYRMEMQLSPSGNSRAP